MNRLWIFGDSYSEPFDKILHSDWRREYSNWKGYIPKCYGEYISIERNYVHTNLAIGGADNYTILDSIINSLDKINKDDIIIIGWSNTLRFRVASMNSSFNTIRPGGLARVIEINNSSQKCINLSDSSIIEMLLNRESDIYINELNNYIKLLNFTFKENKIIHWSPFRQETQGLHTTLSLIDSNCETITMETNGILNDTHYSENFHKTLGNQIIDIIDNYLPNLSKNSLI
jgi:hypothetical protein